tara:strand:+ start:125 stop:484 length:360 start_codon:yes stop_codon:yes gene_type:complete
MSDLESFYDFTDNALLTILQESRCADTPYGNYEILKLEGELKDNLPNDWEEWRGDKDEEHYLEFLEDIGFTPLGSSGYFWNIPMLERLCQTYKMWDGFIQNIQLRSDVEERIISSSSSS